MDFTTLAAMMRTLFSLFGDVRPDVHCFSMTLFGAAIKSVKHTDKKGVENQVLDSLVPLLLYSQDENDAIAEESQRVLTICAHFLKWKLPQEVYCRDPLYIRPTEAGKICRFFVPVLVRDPLKDTSIQNTSSVQQAMEKPRFKTQLGVCKLVREMKPAEINRNSKWKMTCAKKGASAKCSEQHKVRQGIKCRGKINILAQTLMYSKNTKLPIRRAAVVFVGLLSKYMDQNELSIKGTDWIQNDLREMLHDPEPSLRIIVSQALFRVQKAMAEPEPEPSVCWLRKLMGCLPT
ncbi:Hypothetical predicted protein [Marmota monax]|uniref:Maestro/Maestro-like HEAT-repeats domain-containing protein n=1 Tax=Marmota monax TaxID=9995 RepID=A0A5E4BJQ0_MARMO|nr:hypothetical protein GHT09_003807 [Marmota monax]VTJ69645.1 Hypothetical predicted protein [Marmota monax]